MRHISVELFFDEQMEQKLLEILEGIAEAGLPSPLLDWGMRPHLTAVLCREVDAALAPALAGFAAARSALPVVFGSVGSFPGDEGAVFLPPVATPALLDLHAAIHELCAPHCHGSDGRYAPGNWIAHCTLSVLGTPAQVAETLAFARDIPFPIRGRLASIGLHETELEGDPGESLEVMATLYPHLFAFQDPGERDGGGPHRLS